MDILIQFHYTHKVLFKLLKLSTVCSNDISLLLDDLSQLYDFSRVKIDSVLKVGALLAVFTTLGLILVLFLDFSDKFT